MVKILSWNINGLRKKIHLLKQYNEYDIICIQETKLRKGLTCFMYLKGYYDFHSLSNVKLGYSGVSIYTKILPINMYEINNDNEGRILILEYDKFCLICVYVPNSGQKLERLKYKTNIWMNKFKLLINDLYKENNKPFILAGDFNATFSRTVYDIHKPSPKQAGNTDEEIETLIDFTKKLNLIDTYKHIHPKKVKYTYWSNYANARYSNKGWRIDFIFVNKSLLSYIKSMGILNNSNQSDSDHAPIYINIDI